MKKRSVLCLASLLAALAASAATLGEWGSSFSDAKALAKANDRPVMVLFSNSSGTCNWCNRFSGEILNSRVWTSAAAQQRMAMVSIDYNTSNWDALYYQNICSNYTSSVTGFPAVVFYDSTGTNRLAAFTFRGNDTYAFTSDGFIQAVKAAIGSYWTSVSDPWDPTDDKAIGATLLTFKAIEQMQSHTIGVTDRVDWFSFTPRSGTTYKLQLADDLSLNYVENTNLTVDSLVYTTNIVVDAALTLGHSYLSATNTSVLAVATNVVGVYTNTLTLSNYISFTNSLVLETPVTNILYAINGGSASSFWANAEASGIWKNATNLLAAAQSIAATNLPSGSTAYTTNSLPESGFASPWISVLAPPAASDSDLLDFSVGPAGSAVTTNRCALTSITTGLFFTPPSADNGKTCFIRIEDAGGSTGTNRISVTETYPAVTNRTTTVSYSNKIVRAVSYAGLVSNVVDRLDFEFVSVSATSVTLAIITNRVTTTESLTITNLIRRLAYSNVTDTVSSGTKNKVYQDNGVAYDLVYETWTPGTVGFNSTNITVSESAAQIKIPVTRKGGSTGAVTISYHTEPITATEGSESSTAGEAPDYLYTEGTLVWADGKAGSTNIVITLVQDLLPVWEGNERFRVVLEPADTSAQAAISVPEAIVTLRETAKKVPGKITFTNYTIGDGSEATTFANPSKPSIVITEGQRINLCVSRRDGSNDVAAARVYTASGTAKDGTAFHGINDTLKWDDENTSDIYETIDTIAQDGYQANATFTVRLAATGASAGTPSIVTVTILDSSVSARLEDTTDETSSGLALKSAGGAWFWSATEGEMNSKPLTKGTTATSQLAIIGPGVLTFNWDVDGWEDGDVFTCTGGVIGKRSYNGSPESTEVLVKPGKQTVTWSYSKRGSAPATAKVSNLLWQPLPSVGTPMPEDGARTDETALSFNLVTADAVRISSNCTAEAASAVFSTEFVGISPKGTVSDSASTTLNELFGAEPVSGKTYAWRVDTVYTDTDTEESVRRTGPRWSLTYQETSGTTAVPADSESDGSYLLAQGVAYDSGNLSGAEDGMAYAIIKGHLPSGLGLTARTGRISGIPTKPGTFTAVLQATETSSGVRSPYTSSAVTFKVLPLGDSAGTYGGWARPSDAARVPYSGSASFVLSQTGAWTLKALVNGKVFIFSAKGLGSFLSETGIVSSVSADTISGTRVLYAKEYYTNTVENLSIEDGTLTAMLTLYTVSKVNGTNALTQSSHSLTLFRNDWAKPGFADALSRFKGYYTAALPVNGLTATNAPTGTGYATFTIGTRGSVKLNGFLADGTAWSASGTLIYPIEAGNENEAWIYVWAQPSSYKTIGGLCGILDITIDGTGENATAVEAGGGENTLCWWNFSPFSIQDATSADVTDDSGFVNALAVSGAYYDKVMNLQTFYLNRTLTFADSGNYPAIGSLPTDYDGASGTSGYTLVTGDDDLMLPFGMAITVGINTFSVATREIVRDSSVTEGSAFADIVYSATEDDEGNALAASTNLGALKLSLTRATGLLKGSFVLNYEAERTNGTYQQKTRTVTLQGIYAPHAPEALAFGLGTQGQGFYTLPDTDKYLDANGNAKTYTFKRSFGFELQGVPVK
jgi:hypothetical protein